VRRNALLANGYARSSSPQGVPLDDSRFIDNIGAVQSIVTSSAREDSGLFEQNLQDERYLPFEGAGAVSRWCIQLPKETNQLDFSTITDVVFTLRYTARDGGELLRTAALEHLAERLRQADALYRMFSARHNFPDAWHRFLTPRSVDSRHVFEMKDLRKHVPAVLGSSDLDIRSMFVVLGLKEGVAYDSPLKFSLKKDEADIGDEHALTLGVERMAALPAAQVLTAGPLDNGVWKISFDMLNPASIEDVWFVIEYAKRPAGP
jgi:hypothetical protein